MEDHVMNVFNKREFVPAMITEVLNETGHGNSYVIKEIERLRTFNAVDIDDYTMLIQCNFYDDSDHLEILLSFSPPAPSNLIEDTNKMIQIYNSRASYGGVFELLSIPPRTVASTTLINIKDGIDKEAFRNELENAILSGTFFFPYLMEIFKGEIS